MDLASTRAIRAISWPGTRRSETRYSTAATVRRAVGLWERTIRGSGTQATTVRLWGYVRPSAKKLSRRRSLAARGSWRRGVSGARDSRTQSRGVRCIGGRPEDQLARKRETMIDCQQAATKFLADKKFHQDAHYFRLCFARSGLFCQLFRSSAELF